MVTTASLLEISRFHEMVLFLRAGSDHPTIVVQSVAGEHLAEVRLTDSATIHGKVLPLDRMSLEEWLSLHYDDIKEAWHQCQRDEPPHRIAGLPEDWPIGGPAPTRPISVKPLAGFRLWVEWEDGSSGELDLHFLADHPSFASWRDQKKFRSVRINGSCFTWGEGMEVCGWLDCWPDLEKAPAMAESGAGP